MYQNTQKCLCKAGEGAPADEEVLHHDDLMHGVIPSPKEEISSWFRL